MYFGIFQGVYRVLYFLWDVMDLLVVSCRLDSVLGLDILPEDFCQRVSEYYYY